MTAESWVLELARRQQMNTDVRKNIFCVLMTSEVLDDYSVCVCVCESGHCRTMQMRLSSS